jgi:hypothetical protein
MNVKHSIGALPLSLLCLSSLLFAERVRLQEGTAVRVRLKAELMSDRVEEGNRVDFEVARPVVVRGMIVIPEGALAWGAVQSVKKDKSIKFDIEGVRLPDLTEIKLRCIREKSKNPGKDQIKIETQYGETVGVPRGSEFTAYIDEEAWAEAAAPAASPAVQRAPAPVAPAPTQAAPVEVRTPAPVAPAPAVSAPAPAVQPTPSAVQPAAPAVPPAAAATGERITVECFSDPSGAEILIDGDFYGNTPSILNVPVGDHRFEIQLAGYKSYSQSLNLPSGAGLRTIRAPLEKKE